MVRIAEEVPHSLAEYEKVPIAFRVESQFRVEVCEGGLVNEGLNEPVFIAGPLPPIFGAMNTGSNPADLGPSVLGGIRLIEEPVTPYIKDYDHEEKYRPSQWHRHWDLSSWGIWGAFIGNQRVGGAAVAWKTPGLDMLDDCIDQACLWDLRVHPDHRGRGIGGELFAHAAAWSKVRSCRVLVIETQNINVPACRFYARQDCELASINRYAYEPSLNETQLIWQKRL